MGAAHAGAGSADFAGHISVLEWGVAKGAVGAGGFEWGGELVSAEDQCAGRGGAFDVAAGLVCFFIQMEHLRGLPNGEALVA
jgi:hypothetical protein